MRNKILALFTALTTIFFLSVSQAQASENFTTDYNVIYSIEETGTTKAALSITLTNTTAQYYASSYKMQVGFDQIENLRATDPEGAIKAVSSKTADGYEIELTFNRKSVGIGSKLPFNVYFDTSSIAKKSGNVWEINIPGISDTTAFNSFVVNIKTPTSFGKPTFIKPVQAQDSLTFNKEQLGKSGISIAFGEKQILDYTLIYHLGNSNVYPVKTEIALPPTTNYQEVLITDISPRPHNVTIDKDGNWLAQYSLKSGEKKTITVKGQVQLRLNPTNSTLTNEERAEYTKKTTNWQKDHPEIKKLAEELKTPRAIYDYLVKTLKYDFSRVTGEQPRLGAVGSLKKPDSAVCREFTDLFIALSRANGIPAREVDGFAYTENSRQRPLSLVEDILHAWPEYYDDKRQAWIMVDPTWGSTTGGVDYFNVLDFDHFAFVKKGVDDSYPVPAGGYKLTDSKNKKDISVSFSQTPLTESGKADLRTSITGTKVAGLPLKSRVTITNTGSVFIPEQNLNVKSSSLSPKEQNVKVDSIPPFGSTTVEVNFDKTTLLTNEKTSFTMRYSGKNYDQSVHIAPFFLTIFGIGGISFAVLTFIIFILATKGRRLHVSK